MALEQGKPDISTIETDLICGIMGIRMSSTFPQQHRMQLCSQRVGDDGHLMICRASLDVNGSMWGKRQGSTGSSGGSRDSKEGSEVPYSELLPLFRKRQLAHAQDEEQRRGAGPESGEHSCFGSSALHSGAL